LLSKATLERQAYLRKPRGECKQIPGGFRKLTCSSYAAIEQLFHTTGKSLAKFVKILKHLARGKIKLMK
jgi:hypothetical protein